MPDAVGAASFDGLTRSDMHPAALLQEGQWGRTIVVSLLPKHPVLAQDRPTNMAYNLLVGTGKTAATDLGSLPGPFKKLVV